MSKSTISISFKMEDGADGLKQLTLDADGLRKVMSAAVTEAERLKKPLVNFASLAMGIDSVSSSLRSLQNTLKGFSDAYAMQIEAETKLATAMRNTMGAREEDIQSIKDLCSAQQEIGVIGDEVLLAGALELATYLNEKRSLEQLIPVMNDMLAQQYGLNATQENAAQIATMLGKVMDGQVGALSRYGYSFDAAQEQILKFGTEAQRVATLCDVVTASVGGTNTELAKTDVGRLKQVENTLGDINEQLGGLISGAMPLITISANSIIALAGVAKLCAGAKTAAVAFMGLRIKQTAANIVIRATGVYSKQAALGLEMLRATAKGTERTMLGLQLAIRGLLMASVVGAAVAGLVWVISELSSNSDDAAESTNKLLSAEERAKRNAEQLEDLRKQEESTLTSTRAALEINISKLKEFNGTKEQERKLVNEMNDTYGETMGYFSSVADWYNALISNSEAYCRQMIIEARTRTLANQIAEKEQERYDIQSQIDNDQLSHERKTVEKKSAGPNTYYVTGAVREEVIGTSEYDRATSALLDLDGEITNLTDQLRSEIEELSSIQMSAKGSNTRPDLGTGAGKDKGGQSGANAPEWTDSPQTLREYTANIEILKKQLLDADKVTAVSINRQIAAFSKEADAIRNAGVEGEKNKAVWHDEAKSIAEVEENLRYLNAEFDKATTNDARADINGKIEAQQNLADYYRGQGKTKEVATVDPDAFNLKGITANIAVLNEQLQSASEETAAAINKEIEAWEKKADAIRNAGKEAKSASVMMREGYQSLKGIGSGVEGITSALEGNGNAWQTVTGLIDGFIQLHEGLMRIVDIMDLLGKVTKKNTADTISQTEATNADTMASLANTSAKSGEAVAEATASGAKLPFPANIAAIAAGVAAVVSALAVVGSFATGGIVGGTSPSGDKLLARVNSGEMILNQTQQARLFKMLNGQYAIRGVSVPQPRYAEVKLDTESLHRNSKRSDLEGGTVKFKIDGRTLVGVLEKENNLKHRS